MPRTPVNGVMYDADTRTLDFKIMEEILEDADNKYGRWYTKQPWYAILTFHDNQWHFDSRLHNEPRASFSDTCIFELIATVLEELGA